MTYLTRFLALLSVVSAALSTPAEAQPHPYTLFIGPCQNCPTDGDEYKAFEETRQRLTPKLHIVNEVTATYGLQDVTFTDESDDLLRVSVTFHVRSEEPIPIVATSKASSNLRYRIATALDNLLRKTLFDPNRGPYYQLKVTNCQVTPDLPDEFALQINWQDSGIGLDPHLVYEFAVVKEGVTPVPMDVYVYFDEARPGQGQSVPAKVWPGDRAKGPHRCPPGPFLLLRHSMVPQVSQGRQYENFRQP